jgi:cob(I)alamin adenosyltransferase
MGLRNTNATDTTNMGHRISKVYTRTGDGGDTALGDGSRVPKDHARVETVGEVDEINCALGVVLSYNLPAPVRESLTRIQHELFDLGGELCIPNHRILNADHVKRLEHELEIFNTELPHLREFILPGGGRAASMCHLARAICRRAERSVVTLARSDDVSEHALAYLNRLSDLLFVVARMISRSEGRREVLWNTPRSKS